MYKTYEKYKPIDLPWLCQIPSSWGQERNKVFLKERKTVVGEDFANYTLLSLTLGGVIVRDIESGKGKFPKEFNMYKIVSKDDLVLCLFDMDETPRTIGLSNNNGMITGAYDVFSVSGINKEYLYYYYLSLDNTKSLKPYYTSLRKVIRMGTFMGINMPVPPRPEQDAIVAFLDKKMAMIDVYIANKKNLIEKLIEYKKAVVNEAVTKGINPNVEMKDSGVDWLGSVPAHWDISHLGKLLTMVSIKHRQDCQLLSVVREKGVIVRDIDNIEENHNFIPEDLSNYKYVRESQFVINKMKAWQGSYGVSNYEGIVSPAYYVMDLHFENKEFFNLAIRSKVYVNFFAQYSDGIRIGQWDLSKEKMKTIPFFIPSSSEQKEIVQYVQKKHQEINRKVAYIEKQIELMQEYRTRLISDAVTGKICVL